MGLRRSGARRPPRAVLQAAWHLHRFVFRLTGRGLERAGADRMGTLALRTVGRNSGLPRETLLWYLADGANLVVVASNAGSDRHPGWWLNLEANPEAEVRTGNEWLPHRARRARGDELARLWSRVTAANPQYAEYGRAAGREIPVVVLEPSMR